MCIKAIHLHIRYIPLIQAIGVSAGDMTTSMDFHADIPITLFLC